jgi:hypothetical protein
MPNDTLLSCLYYCCTIRYMCVVALYSRVIVRHVFYIIPYMYYCLSLYLPPSPPRRCWWGPIVRNMSSVALFSFFTFLLSSPPPVPLQPVLYYLYYTIVLCCLYYVYITLSRVACWAGSCTRVRVSCSNLVRHVRATRGIVLVYTR